MVLVLGALGGVAGARVRKRETLRDGGGTQAAHNAVRDGGEVRRQVAEAIHDGPVQELIALDMVLASARHALVRGDHERSEELLAEARELTQRNVHLLREELVELSPYTFEQASYEAALERRVPVWTRRYGLELHLAIDPVALTAEAAGELFRITQEAVINAGRHAEAKRVSISLRTVDGKVELRVADDGRGLPSDPLADREPGHLGLMSIRARAELLGGALNLESSERGTSLVVRVPPSS